MAGGRKVLARLRGVVHTLESSLEAKAQAYNGRTKRARAGKSIRSLRPHPLVAEGLTPLVAKGCMH